MMAPRLPRSLIQFIDECVPTYQALIRAIYRIADSKFQTFGDSLKMREP